MSSSSDAAVQERPIITVQQHILHQQQQCPEATGEFSWLLSGLTLATKMIQAKVRRAGLTEILGAAGEINVQGEAQQKLDVYANQAMIHCLSERDTVAVLASEENEKPLTVHLNPDQAKYVIVFDPLDGSSNIDVNVSVGTTFSILKRTASDDPEQHVLQPGHKQVAAGYVVYGSSTIFVYSAGRGVHGFTLDPAVGAYVLSHEDIRMPEQGTYYSVNEAYSDRMPEAYRVYMNRLRAGELG
ncbi:MAG: fructose-1,6-bisphosphatase, partial [Planctomycetales bacterium]